MFTFYFSQRISCVSATLIKTNGGLIKQIQNKDNFGIPPVFTSPKNGGIGRDDNIYLPLSCVLMSDCSRSVIASCFSLAASTARGLLVHRSRN